MTTAERARRRSTETIWNQRVTLFLVLGFIAYQVFIVNPKTDEIHTAICINKTNIAGRIVASEDFLKKHPHGVPGISKAVVLAGEARDQAALDAYSVVDC